MPCLRCGGGRTWREGQTRLAGQRWRCPSCRRFTTRSASAFAGRGFADDVIALAVRWYVRYRLSNADVAEWLAERGFLNNGLERDHGNLKQRLRPMRGFRQRTSADTFVRGHAIVQNLRSGCSSLTDRVPRPLRLATAWPQLARAI